MEKGSTPLFALEDLAKRVRQHDAHGQPADAYYCCALNVMHSEVSDAKDQQVTDDGVERSPKDVDHRRRHSLTRRLGEWARKRAAHDPAHKVWNCVHRKCASEKVRDVAVPGHVSSSAGRNWKSTTGTAASYH